MLLRAPARPRARQRCYLSLFFSIGQARGETEFYDTIKKGKRCVRVFLHDKKRDEAMYGTCDVPGCTNKTYMGWRPVTERLGRQICEYHWLRHKDPNDDFNLFDAFSFRRAAGIRKSAAKKEIARCACGRERLPRCKFCTDCAQERERQRKREVYYKRKNLEPEPVEQRHTPLCAECGGPREPGHRYCQKCGERHKRIFHRRRQSRYWKREHTCTGLN
jgi:hypothetical protein